jgi:predicted nucleic acid-binding protein
MQKIDFNSPSFKRKGFEDNEDILIDSGVILAYLNAYDSWHNTVNELFEKYIFNNEDNVLFLYVNPTIVNEVTHILDKPAVKYEEKHGVVLSDADKANMAISTADRLKQSIENEIFIVLEGNKASVLKQLEIFNTLGAVDAVNVSIANEYGISFLTVDNKLVRNLAKIGSLVPDIHNVYYTTPKYLT